MPAEGSPTDVPPAAFGRYRALHHIGVGSLGPVFYGDDPATGHTVTIHLLRLGVTPDLARGVFDGLLHLRDRLPDHDAIPPVIDAGVEHDEPFYVTPLVTGDSLDRALERYGPAAIVDAVARLRQLATALDRAAEAGMWHGALQPQDIVVSTEHTAVGALGVVPLLERLGAPTPARTPYTAPEIADAEGSSAAADQYALAVIAHEWIFGCAVAGLAGSIELPTLPGVSHERLSDAFATALAAAPEDRFHTCGAFVEALSASVVRDIPAAREAPVMASLPLEDDALEPAGQAALRLDQVAVDEVPLAPAITNLTLDDEEAPARPAPVMWQGALAAEPVREEARGYGAGALAAALVVGIGIGIGASYWLGARPGPLVQRSGPEFTDAAVPARAPETPPRIADPPVVPAVREAEVERSGRLLVRTLPPGARVTVDGVDRGVSPLMLRDLELGPHTVTLERSGSTPVERSVTLTADRPSRTLEEKLSDPPSRPAGRFGVAGGSSPQNRAAPGTPKRPADAAGAKAAESVSGSAYIASRPAGAAVMIDGRPAGTTPLTVPSLSAGSHTVRIDRPGYRPWTTTVQITEGARARVAASLVGGKAQE